MSKYVIPFVDNRDWKSYDNCPICKIIDNFYNQIFAQHDDSVKQMLIEQLENCLVDGYKILEIEEKNGYAIYNNDKINEIKDYKTNNDLFMSKVRHYFDSNSEIADDINIDDAILFHSRWCKRCGARKPDIYDPTRGEISYLLPIYNFNLTINLSMKWTDLNTNDSWAETRVIRKTYSEPLNVNDGDLILRYTDSIDTYKDQPFLDENLEPNIQYCYKIFWFDSTGNIIDSKNINIKDIEQSIRVNWEDASADNWYKTRLVRKSGSKPIDDKDGVEILEYTDTFNKYRNVYYPDYNVNAGEIYYYQVFLYDFLDNIITKSDIKSVYLTTNDIIPPSAINDLSTVHEREIKIVNSIPLVCDYIVSDWTEPKDQDWNGTVLCIDDSIPQTENDGFKVDKKMLYGIHLDWEKLTSKEILDIFYELKDDLDNNIPYNLLSIFNSTSINVLSNVTCQALKNPMLAAKLNNDLVTRISEDVSIGFSGILANEVTNMLSSNFIEILTSNLTLSIMTTIKSLLPMNTNMDDLSEQISIILKNILLGIGLKDNIYSVCQEVLEDTFNALIAGDNNLPNLLNLLQNSLINIDVTRLIGSLCIFNFDDIYNLFTNNINDVLINNYSVAIGNCADDEVDYIISTIKNILIANISTTLIDALQVNLSGINISSIKALNLPKQIYDLIINSYDDMITDILSNLESYLTETIEIIFIDLEVLSKNFLIDFIIKLLNSTIKENINIIINSDALALLMLSLNNNISNYLNESRTLYFKVFPYDMTKYLPTEDNTNYISYKNYNHNSNSSYVVMKPMDAMITNIVAIPSNGKVELTWEDLDSDQWDHTNIVYKLSNEILNYKDSDYILFKKIYNKNNYISTPLVIDGLINNVVYYIGVIPVDKSGVWNINNDDQINVKTIYNRKKFVIDFSGYDYNDQFAFTNNWNVVDYDGEKVYTSLILDKNEYANCDIILYDLKYGGTLSFDVQMYDESNDFKFNLYINNTKIEILNKPAWTNIEVKLDKSEYTNIRFEYLAPSYDCRFNPVYLKNINIDYNDF